MKSISPSSHQSFARQLAMALLCAVGGAILLFFAGLLALYIGMQPTRKNFSPPEARQEVARTLMGWGVFDLTPGHDPDYERHLKFIVGQIRTIHGCSEIGWPSDGVEWYVMDFTPEMAEALRNGLLHCPSVTPSGGMPAPGESPPSWWLEPGPSDAIGYQKGQNFEYFFISAKGTRAEFMRIHS
jgi:hypothetical protein